MIDDILSWFAAGDGAATGTRRSRDELQLALAALLVEAAQSDDHLDESERTVIIRLLERRFRIAQSQALSLLEKATHAADRSVELFRFTRTINERLTPPERIELIEMLWEVAYADGVLDKYEDSLLRRIGGLIYVADPERGLARQRVMKRLGIEEAE